VLVFGSVVAAMLPLAVGVFAILASLAILRALTLVTDVSIYALNLTTALGLALAIDYSLFMVSRFREELGNGRDIEAAVIRTVQTAGRTVLYSALVVGLSLAALLVFPVYFLASFAYSGLATIAAAALAAILFLPACLILLGERVNAWDLRRLFRKHAPTPVPPERSWWYRMVGWVTRHAVLVAIAVTLLLLTLGAPFLSAAFAYPDDRVITTAAPSRVVGDALRADFPVDVSTPIEVVLPGYSAGSAALGEYAAQLSRAPGVTNVLSAVGTYVGGQQIAPGVPGMANDAGAYVTVAGGVDPFSQEGTAQLETLRAVPAPAPAIFGGAAAANTDALNSLSSRLPVALTLIAISTFVVLFLFTGSVVLPVKAILLNTLSLSAAFGAMVWIFQEGHFSGLLGFTATDYLVPTMPILMFCLAFGMSMDYEVFLLSRVREEWLAGPRTSAANTHAVAMGVARTGRIFTAAAALMAIVFIAMTSSQVSFIKMFGLGLTITVLTDATLIRCCLAPALMHLMGRANWWAPRPLVRLHARIGLTEDGATLPPWSPSTSRTQATPPASNPPN
jgi:RND superfamily putative drug exporter